MQRPSGARHKGGTVKQKRCKADIDLQSAAAP